MREIRIEIVDLTNRDGAILNGFFPKPMLADIRSANFSDIELDRTRLSGATTMGSGDRLFELIISDITPDDCPY